MTLRAGELSAALRLVDEELQAHPRGGVRVGIVRVGHMDQEFEGGLLRAEDSGSLISSCRSRG
ncbi:hypothetical protein GCM10010121_059320 [Streptomyces brasiliensis]|uniref:Uncharacterized protein n=1 Tax=Streptomyces brasiliensis TaxID=1954 RepID=A0A917L1F2_9ACTN|nr:hypothetical protein GCM10010121_059320 [Streptomyces brasiliensis]